MARHYIAPHLTVHLCVATLWILIALTILPVTWLAINDAAWRAGPGAILTERPIAAIHNRVMGTIQEMETLGERQGYLEGHLRDYADAPAAERAAWRDELDQVNDDRNRLIAQVAIVAILCYLPVGLAGELWLRRNRNVSFAVEAI